jgi:hypothetical protein
MGGSPSYSQNEEPERYPSIMCSKQSFDNWFSIFAFTLEENYCWLSSDAKREVFYIQDYFYTLYNCLSDIHSDSYPRIGVLLREDFIDLSVELEKKGYSFFCTELNKLKLPNINDPHKYPQDITHSRLQKTKLLANCEKISSFK